jgi:hypothetical protein
MEYENGGEGFSRFLETGKDGQSLLIVSNLKDLEGRDLECLSHTSVGLENVRILIDFSSSGNKPTRKITSELLSRKFRPELLLCGINPLPAPVVEAGLAPVRAKDGDGLFLDPPESLLSKLADDGCAGNVRVERRNPNSAIKALLLRLNV